MNHAPGPDYQGGYQEGYDAHPQYMDQSRVSYNGPNGPYQPPPQSQPYHDPYQAQPRSHSHSYNQPSHPIPQARSQSESYPQTGIPPQQEPLHPSQQLFTVEDSDGYGNTTKSKSNKSGKSKSRAINVADGDNDQEVPSTSFEMIARTTSIEQDKIQQLEEKIQRLERVLALQELESKTSRSSTSIDKVPDISSEPQQQQQPAPAPAPAPASASAPALPTPPAKSTKTATKSASKLPPLTNTGAPPLPPPPPADKKSLLNSPKANLFLSGLDSSSKGSDDLRLSASSLIPTEKSLSDLSDGDGDHSIELNDEEPPPSYEELEKSGSLTYSQSIYRTGFEKAGYQMDHVITPTNPVAESSNETTKSTGKITRELMSKRKIPSQITDEMFEKAAFKTSLSSIPTLSSETPAKTVTESSTSQLKSSVTAPSPVQIPSQMSQVPPPIAAKSQNSLKNHVTPFHSEFKPPARLENSASTINSKQSRSTMDSSLYTPKATTSELTNIIKYSTDLSFESLANGVIKPILPSQSRESTEETIARFRKTREKALADYKQFTPRVQFFWAILLVETLSKSEVLSKMTIDGKLRKNPVSYKKLKKQRLMFLTTAIKVLEKLIQIAPNDTRARLYLGDIYSGGIHPGLIERDEALGYQLFYDAATKQNDPVACYRIACCLESGVGCKQDISKSIVFFERGATLGDPSAMCQLGMMHFAGVNGCVQDISLSIAYHKQAYETLRSRTVMGFDPLISSRSFQDARGALYTLAKLHQTDRQILCLADGNDDKTRKTIEELKFANVWCNSSKALKYYLEAAKLGHNESQACLGYYYSQGFFPTYSFKSDKEANDGVPNTLDARKSIYWFSKAAADGHTYASLGLARWYGSGAVDGEGKVILKRDEQQAFLWGRKAADAGELAEAEFMIGVCFEQGFGVEKNAVMAANYFERSGRKGYKKAIQKLKAMKNATR